MVKFVIALLLLFSNSYVGFSQENNDLSLKGLFIAQPTVAPSLMFHDNLINSYFHATLEYFPENKFSIRTDGFYFFTTQGSNRPFKYNHSMLLGLYYHIVKPHSSYAFGIQPGAAYVKQNAYSYKDSLITDPELRVAPILSFSVGANYYFWKIFNFFINVNFVHGNHIAQYGNAIPLTELRFSGGLGWNFRIKKQ